MKDLILITSYCPDSEKKEMLFEFLKSLQKFRNEYDIFLSSHLPIDNFYFNYVDYFYYDKNNTILDDIEYRQNSWFSPENNYIIWSSYTHIGNTISAIWDMIIPSISMAKSLNYRKIHYVEYDSLVTDLKEIKENSDLLEDNDYVIYSNPNGLKMIGALMSFRVDGIIKEWEKKDEEEFKKLYIGKYPKFPENIMFNLIEGQRKYVKKDINNVTKNGLTISRINTNREYWNVPFFDPNDSKLKFLSRNMSNKEFNVKIFVNDNFINIGNVKPNSWKIVDILNNFYDTKKILVLVDNIKTLELNFKDEKDKNVFITFNSVKRK